MIWAIGLIGSWFRILDDLANPRTRLNLVPILCSAKTYVASNKKNGNYEFKLLSESNK